MTWAFAIFSHVTLSCHHLTDHGLHHLRTSDRHDLIVSFRRSKCIQMSLHSSWNKTGRRQAAFALQGLFITGKIRPNFITAFCVRLRRCLPHVRSSPFHCLFPDTISCLSRPCSDFVLLPISASQDPMLGRVLPLPFLSHVPSDLVPGLF